MAFVAGNAIPCLPEPVAEREPGLRHGGLRTGDPTCRSDCVTHEASLQVTKRDHHPEPLLYGGAGGDVLDAGDAQAGRLAREHHAAARFDLEPEPVRLAADLVVPAFPFDCVLLVVPPAPDWCPPAAAAAEQLLSFTCAPFVPDEGSALECSSLTHASALPVEPGQSPTPSCRRGR